jgi:uncharacterized phage protein (TIGR02220 family)
MSRRNQPYIPLYADDFQTDEKLAMCSAESTGVFIRIMCLMHKSEPYGKILLKQKFKQTLKQISNFASQLAIYFPYDSATIERSLAELVDEDVLQLEDDFLIQKRMVRDAEISEIRGGAGKKGGQKSSEKRKESTDFATPFASDFAQANTQANTVIGIGIENGIGSVVENGIAVVKKNETAIALNDDYQSFIQTMQEVTGRDFRGDKKSRAQFKARIKDGYTLEDFKRAAHAAASTVYHQSNKFDQLTPELLTRPDKLEAYCTKRVSAPVNTTVKINRSQTVGEVADIHKQFAELRNQTNTSSHE